MLPVDSGDGIVEPGVGGDKPVCDGPVATDRRIGSGPLPVGRHNSMSLLQAPNSMSLDGGARVVGAGILNFCRRNGPFDARMYRLIFVGSRQKRRGYRQSREAPKKFLLSLPDLRPPVAGSGC